MRKGLLLLLLWGLLGGICSAAAQRGGDDALPEEFWLGADISATTMLEHQGIFSYNAQGVRTENTLLMQQLGMNAIRLRVWVDPRGGWSSKEDLLAMALRAQRLGMPILVCFHYSDWWADPGKQYPPAAWADLSYEPLCLALAQHTRETLTLLRDHGIDVRWVQVGNETSNGFLWPVGHRDRMEQYAGLTEAGYQAVKSVFPDAQVIVHLDNGFDHELYRSIFDALHDFGTHWDMIGMSIYPYWAIQAGREPDAEATLCHSLENISLLAERYQCPVMIVETGVEAQKPDEGYDFLSRLIDGALRLPGAPCKGVFYWAPESYHGGYPLGAFIDDRPSRIMDAFSEAAQRLQKNHAARLCEGE